MKFHKYFIKTKWLKVCDLDSQDSGINSYDGELPQFFVLKVITLMKIEKAPQNIPPDFMQNFLIHKNFISKNFCHWNFFPPRTLILAFETVKFISLSNSKNNHCLLVLKILFTILKVVFFVQKSVAVKTLHVDTGIS